MFNDTVGIFVTFRTAPTIFLVMLSLLASTAVFTFRPERLPFKSSLIFALCIFILSVFAGAIVFSFFFGMEVIGVRFIRTL